MASNQQLLQQAQKDLKQKDYALAQDKAHTIIKTEPSNSAAWHLLGLVSLDGKNYTEALGYFQKAVSSTPKALYYFNMAIAYRRLDKNLEAIRAYHQCVKIDPKMVRAWSNLGNCYRLVKQNDKALNCYTKALNLEPENNLTHYNLGILFQDEDRLDDAIKSYRRAIKYNPNNARAHCNLGTVYSHLRRYKKSISYYEKALEIDDHLFDAYNNYGGTLIELEQFNEADKKLRKALKLQPDAASTLRNISLCKRYEDANDKDAQYILQLLEKPDLSDTDKVELYFALGKIYHDTKQYEKAFFYFDQGNELHYDQEPFNIFSLQDYVQSIMKLFDESFIMTHKNMTHPKVQPLIIIGSPRSGKSLLEKNLMLHKEIDGAGEIGLVEFASTRHTQDGIEHFPDWVSQIDESSSKEIMKSYENKLLIDANQRTYVIDTMPGNAYYLGLIAMLFPKAKIIYVDRNPLDLNLFMYFKYFISKHLYAYNLTSLGRYHKLFQCMMSHWQKVLPDQIHTIQYEDLVLKTKQTMTGVFGFLGLHSDKMDIPEQLDAFEIGQHHHYESQLGPLKKALEFDPLSNAVKVRQVLNDAMLKHKEKKYEEAAKLYRYVIHYEPKNPVPVHLLGVVAFETGRHEKAVELIKESLKINPNYAEAHGNLGIVFKALGQNKEANEHLRLAEAIIEATQTQHHKILNDEQRNVLRAGFSRELKVIEEHERKILLLGEIHEHQDTTKENAVSQWRFKDLSYGSYRPSGSKETPNLRMHSWDFMIKYLAVVDKIFKNPKDEIHILDVGCGTGYLRRFIEGNVSPFDDKKIFYWGLDSSKDKLEMALKAATHIETGAAGNFAPSAYVLHDVEKGLPFNDSFFDIIVSFDLFSTLEMRVGVALIYEMYRVLNPDGVISLSCHYDPKDNEVFAAMNYDKIKDLFINKGFEVRGEYGAKSDANALLQALSPEDRPLADKLLQYHPQEVACAMLTPLYPQASMERVFQLYKPN